MVMVPRSFHRVATTVAALAILTTRAPRAHADAKGEVLAAFANTVTAMAAGKPTPGIEMLILPDLAYGDDAATRATLRAMIGKPTISTKALVVSPSGTSAWMAAEIAAKVPRDGKVRDEPIRASAFLVRDDRGWHVRAGHWSFAEPNQIISTCGDIEPWIPPAGPNAAGAEDAFAALEAALHTYRPAAFVALLSDSADAFMFGTAPGESFRGAAIKGLFKRFTLTQVSVDAGEGAPVLSGIAPDGQLLWLVAAVDPPTQYCTSYRAFYVLARERGGWRIVHQHYAVKLNGL
jgi:ketosteroid isomerase-like protein